MYLAESFYRAFSFATKIYIREIRRWQNNK